jgi:anti-anti-sigma regulatory factor
LAAAPQRLRSVSGAAATGIRPTVSAVHHRARSHAGDTIVIACSGDDDLAERVGMTLELGARHVVVDLGDGERVDATTLTALKRVAGRLRSRGGHLSVVCSQPSLTSILDRTLLSRSFAVFGSLDAALRHAGP